MFNDETSDVTQEKQPEPQDELLLRLQSQVDARRAELQRQQQTGLTDKERTMLEVMNGVKAAYPDAVKSAMDEKGREVLVMEHPTDESVVSLFRDNTTVITQNGILLPSGRYDAEDLNLTAISDASSINPKDDFGTPYIPVEKKTIFTEKGFAKATRYSQAPMTQLIVLNEQSEKDLANLSIALRDAQKVGETKKLQNPPAGPKDASQILGSLIPQQK